MGWGRGGDGGRGETEWEPLIGALAARCPREGSEDVRNRHSLKVFPSVIYDSALMM